MIYSQQNLGMVKVSRYTRPGEHVMAQWERTSVLAQNFGWWDDTDDANENATVRPYKLNECTRFPKP